MRSLEDSIEEQHDELDHSDALLNEVYAPRFVENLILNTDIARIQQKPSLKYIKNEEKEERYSIAPFSMQISDGE